MAEKYTILPRIFAENCSFQKGGVILLVGIQDEILRLHSMGFLKELLVDKTTKTNVIWETDAYQELGTEYQRDKEIQIKLVTGQNSDVIKNRARKAMEQQSERTRKHAEVFTPLWICRKMVSYADSVWFGKADAFIDKDNLAEQVLFPKQRKWQHYVDARRLEITCGEAPYLVNRYDVSTGEIISLQERQGVLDRKLRIVNENTVDESDWIKWALRAFQATYGYESQGDNLLIARVNLLMTFEEYLQARWKRKPTAKEYREIIKTIVWNLWQMDGLSGTIPYCKTKETYHQFSLFEWFDSEEYREKVKQQPHCRIYDWRRGNSLEYLNVNKGGKRNMKFDFVIGNPPYQEETLGDNKGFAPPIYNKFLDAAYQVSDKVEMIHPARFLFNAGSTPKTWNDKMLNDSHFTVLHYEPDGSKIFPGTDIKGGVAITYYDTQKDYGAIEIFSAFEELNTILKKVKPTISSSVSSIVSGRGVYKLSDVALEEKPEIIGLQSKGHQKDVGSGAFRVLKDVVFFEEKPENGEEYVKFLGLVSNKRVYYWGIRRYQSTPDSFLRYKVFIPKANGSGALGEVLSTPLIGKPLIGATESFLSIGSFETIKEAENCLKYIKSKFARVLLGVLKITQDNTSAKWKYVPLQDFTPASDIDWSQSVSDIDRQLYKKYGLDDAEIKFIETHVKEMV